MFKIQSSVLRLALAIIVDQCLLTARTAAESPTPTGLTTSDWLSIRAAYEANRHAIIPVGAEFHARNPAQQWRVWFDGQGFNARPDADGWSWGLELVSFGREGSEQFVATPQCIDTQHGRISYQWSDSLTEWYVNDGRGLEHGYTIRRSPEELGPEGRCSALQFTLAVRGELSPQVSSDGRNVMFVDMNGAAVLNYGGLTVFDADGAVLPAWFEAVPTDASESVVFQLAISDDGARYPLTIDPIAQQAYLKASNPGSGGAMGEAFGIAVAISGDTVVIGSPFEDSNATGINGNEADNSATNSGAAYVFVRNTETWSQQAYLKASNTGVEDWFGNSVAISGDTIVVGAPREDSNSAGVNGNQSNNNSPECGAAYVFVRNGAAWSQQAYLKAMTTNSSVQFGTSVAVSGDTVAVGAPYTDSNATDSGSAFVYVRTGTTWSGLSERKAPNPGNSDNFGNSLSISDDVMVVGSQFEDSNSTGVNGDQLNDNAPNSGAAYVFVRNGPTWSWEAYLKASNSESADEFGRAVAISGQTIVVGASEEDSNATGIDGNQNDNSASRAGAAYVFIRNESNWVQQAYLKASNAQATDVFGFSVSASGEVVVVGATGEDSNSTGINGNQNNNSASGSGAAYVFARNGASWSQQAFLKPSNTDSGDQFGRSVAIDGDDLIIGAQLEDSNAAGVNGDQSNNSLSNSGAAYVITICPSMAGDLNCNCIGDAADMPAFVLALLDPDAYEAAHPGCFLNGDMNADGLVNGADIQGFVDLLIP